MTTSNNRSSNNTSTIITRRTNSILSHLSIPNTNHHNHLISSNQTTASTPTTTPLPLNTNNNSPTSTTINDSKLQWFEFKFPLISNNNNITCELGAATTSGSLSNGDRKVNQDSYGFYFGGQQQQQLTTTTTTTSSPPPLFIAVICDGHGIHGEHISSLIKRLTTSHILLSHVNNSTHNNFHTISSTLQNELPTESLESGTTCVILIIDVYYKITCYNVGDSRCIGYQTNKNNQQPGIIQLTQDHKPDSQQELQRIRKLGGVVKKRPGDVARVAGLALSRSFGDFYARNSGVIYDPEITIFDSIEEFKFLILASDGVYDMMNNEEIIEFINEKRKKTTTTTTTTVGIIAQELVAHCRKLWLHDTNGRYCDDITVIIIDLLSPIT
jgi:serine/threonine protein phosphatase PrpC